MYKLLIVEDERWEREGLVHFLNWSELGIEVIGAEANGEKGLALAKDKRPDILITDIKMPIMDGLLLSKEVKKISPECQIIIVTGYDDFEYAQDAINHSVCEYLLKPIQKESLLEAIKRIINRIDRQINENEYTMNLHSQLDELVFDKREHFLQDIVAGRQTWLGLISEINGLDFLNYEYFTAAVIKFDFMTENYYPDIDYIKAKQRDIYKRFCRTYTEKCLIARDENGFFEIILCFAVNSNDRSWINNALKLVETTIDLPKNLKYIVGVGSCVEVIDLFSQSCHEAKTALDQAFFNCDSDIIFYEDIKDRYDQNSCSSKVKTISVSEFSKKILNLAVVSDMQELINITETAFEHISNSGFKKSEVYNFMNCFLNELRIFSVNINDLSYINQSIYQEPFFDRFIRLEDLKKWLQNLLSDIHNGVKRKMINREKQLSDQVMEIIKREYSKNIGINSIAHNMNISSNYLSSMFNKYVGRSFSEVLAEYRVKIAEELLTVKTDSIMKIAKAVGYSNPSYFSTVFKKVNGSTPIEFRKKLSAEENNNE